MSSFSDSPLTPAYEKNRPPPGGPLNHYGAVPDAHDPNDFHFEFDPERALSHSVDLREHCPAIYNQLHMGSCTAHAVAGAFECTVMKEKLGHFSPSRFFIWYFAREKSDDPDAVKKDVGASVRDAIKSVSPGEYGVCSEDDWPYENDEADQTTRYFLPGARAAQKPSPEAMKNALKHTAPEYKRFLYDYPLPQQLMQCLDEGMPFVFVMKYADVLLSNEAMAREPKWTAQRRLKKDLPHQIVSHALVGVGYNREKGCFIIRNSWGETWGDKGYFYLPYDLLDFCYDFWSIKAVSSGSK